MNQQQDEPGGGPAPGEPPIDDDGLVHGPESDSAIVPASQRELAEGQLPQFVSILTPMEQQVGLHVISALQHPETVAVLTTVAMGQDGRQRIVSVGLDPELLEHVQQLLVSAREETTQRVPCVGFQCVVRDREERKEKEDDDGKA
jgi:hypothetical protein